jgi:hypothetical protein
MVLIGSLLVVGGLWGFCGALRLLALAGTTACRNMMGTGDIPRGRNEAPLRSVVGDAEYDRYIASVTSAWNKKNP